MRGIEEVAGIEVKAHYIIYHIIEQVRQTGTKK